MGTTKSVDLEKERKRAKKPAAGHPLVTPIRDPTVDAVDKRAKELRKPPSKRRDVPLKKGKKYEHKPET